VSRRLLIILALCGSLLAFAAAVVLLNGRGADAKEAASRFVTTSASYDPSSESPSEHLLRLSELCEKEFFSRRFDDGTYLKGLSFNRQAEVTETVRVTETELEEYSQKEARVRVAYSVRSSSAEETTTTDKEQVVSLRKASGQWRVIGAEEHYLDG
jgi:hypothetical protein